MSVSICRDCALERSDCKGVKDAEKIKCDYFRKKTVVNIKEMAERIAELEIENKKLRENAVEVVRCKDCKHKTFCSMKVQYVKVAESNITVGSTFVDYCSLGERRTV